MASVAASLEGFAQQGDGQIAVLRHLGLRDGGLLSGLRQRAHGPGTATIRPARAHKGADIIKPLVGYLREKCPGYKAVVHRKLTIAAPNAPQDMIFHWSFFMHLRAEGCYLNVRDSCRALQPGGTLVFSFLEFEDEGHLASSAARSDGSTGTAGRHNQHPPASRLDLLLGADIGFACGIHRWHGHPPPPILADAGGDEEASLTFRQYPRADGAHDPAAEPGDHPFHLRRAHELLAEDEFLAPRNLETGDGLWR